MGYQTWFDEDRMRGDIVDRMTEGIENTKCVIVFMTKNYHGKVNGKVSDDNCRLEFSYARRKKKSDKMLAVVMEPCMTKPREWEGQIGMYLGDKIYIDMTKNVENETYLRKQMKNLQKELWTMGIKPMSNTNKNMAENDPQSGTFLFYCSVY